MFNKNSGSSKQSPQPQQQKKKTTTAQPKSDFFKLNEDKYLEEIKQYISASYNAHYTNGKEGRQLIEDVIEFGDGIPFSRWNIVKYALRYGRKEGHNRKDIIKIIHYALFMLISHDKKFNTNTKPK
jgi:hypothetical protein